MAESAFTSTASTASTASTSAACQGRRLHIVLDLDHTLVNASEHELSLHHPRDASARQLHSFVMQNTENGASPRYLLGLRDGLHAFLQQLEQLATLHVYTMGSKSYAFQVVEIIDPQHKLIFGRILTRSDGHESFIKELVHILPDAAERRGEP